MYVTLPYGVRQVGFDIPDNAFAGMYDPCCIQNVPDKTTEILRAIENPIGTPPLENLIKPNQKVCVIVDDISRPTPVNDILPVLMKKLREIGVMRENIRVVVALGSHRYMTPQELSERVGAAIYQEYEVINSEFKDPSGLVYVGDTPDGVKIMASKSVMTADVRIGIGNLVPHPVMGWGGGGKILYPGVAGEHTVAYFHLKASLIDRNLFGKNTTPIREMMESWVDSIGLDFIINTVLTPDFKIFKVVAGHYIDAFRVGVEEGKKVMGYHVKEKVDVVVVSSHPADQDFWQSPKGMYAAEDALKGDRGGTMILVSPNYEGIGPHAEYPICMGRDNGDDTVRRCMMGEPVSGDPLAIAIGNSMSKMRRRRKLVVVSDGVTSEEMALCGCIHYPTAQLQKAVEDALKEYDNCRIAAMTNGAETFLYD